MDVSDYARVKRDFQRYIPDNRSLENELHVEEPQGGALACSPS